MTSLQPRPPYTQEELEKLYPKELQLELVQVFLRHGERTPVSSRFKTTGLSPYWPYCSAAKRMRAIAATKENLSSWDIWKWQRKIEAFGVDDESIPAKGPNGEVDGIW
ncbi:hypothetical protein KEM54_003857 [Ascosphaera aggregata]|nr:hypothetical protein KEM54_003857 [Ascosphaera aggregata]